MPTVKFGIYTIVHQKTWSPTDTLPIRQLLQKKYPGVPYRIFYCARSTGIIGRRFDWTTPTWVNNIDSIGQEEGLCRLVELINEWDTKILADPIWAAREYSICPVCQGRLRFHQIDYGSIDNPRITDPYYECLECGKVIDWADPATYEEKK